MMYYSTPLQIQFLKSCNYSVNFMYDSNFIDNQKVFQIYFRCHECCTLKL
jgi:hypothetical protein